MDRLTQSRLRRSGDPCDCAKCRGVLVVYTTRVHADEGLRIQYLECNLCHHKPDGNKRVVPLEYFPRRS